MRCNWTELSKSLTSSTHGKRTSPIPKTIIARYIEKFNINCIKVYLKFNLDTIQYNYFSSAKYDRVVGVQTHT